MQTPSTPSTHSPEASPAPSFTPGPWSTAATDDGLILKGRLKIASTFPIGLDPQEEANARLIAAAPELFVALVNLVELCEAVFVKPAENDDLDAARIAIAKAVQS